MTGNKQVHSFHGKDGKLAQGKADELEIDGLMCDRYKIDQIPLGVEIAQGIDRFWTDKMTGLRYSVEYKSDRKALETGNAFLETVSNDKTDKPGWIYTTTAQYVVYYLPGKQLMILSGERLKAAIQSGLLDKRRIGKSFNPGYTSLGALVPLWELASVPGLVIDTFKIMFLPMA